jgi:thiamine biosynthesis lipoprotein
MLGTGCRASAPPREVRYPVMGAFAAVIAAGGEAGRVDDYARIAEAAMREIESELSLYRTNSALSKLNAAAGTGFVEVGPHLRANLVLARRYGDLSGGAFDVTVGPLVRLWGFSGGKVPLALVPADRIGEARARVGYRNIRLEGGRASLDQPGMVIDLGGIAKGYAVDFCGDLLRARGARDFTVNLAGNMRCFGRPSAERPWRIGVRDPFHSDDTLGLLDLEDGMAVSTSGNYERFVEIDGHRYAHIIDPRTGCPVEGMAGVTVLAPSAADADALSTALFVLGVEAGARAIAGVPGVEALFVPDRQPPEIFVTRGMSRVFHPREDTVNRVRVIVPRD